MNNDDTTKHLKPKFTLVGSIAEGTRFGYANELDLGLRFEALTSFEGEGDSAQNIAFEVHGDPFTLKKADTVQVKMERWEILEMQ